MSNDRIKTATEVVTQSLVNFICYKKEFSDVPPTQSILKSAVYTAKAGLDDNFTTSEFVFQLSDNYNKLATLLKQVGEEIALEEKGVKGIRTIQMINAEKTLTSIVAAERLGVSPQAITKAIKEGRLVGTKVGKSYAIKEKDFLAFKNNRKR